MIQQRTLGQRVRKFIRIGFQFGQDAIWGILRPRFIRQSVHSGANIGVFQPA